MSVPVQHPMYIDGQFVTWHDDAWIDVVNPATEEVISRIPDGRAEDACKAIDAAQRAQPQWEVLPAIERANWLRKISAGIRQRASEISALIVAEGEKYSNWLRSKSRLPPTISIIWRSGRVAMKARSCKAIVRARIFCCLSALWA